MPQPPRLAVAVFVAVAAFVVAVVAVAAVAVVAAVVAAVAAVAALSKHIQKKARYTTYKRSTKYCTQDLMHVTTEEC